MKFLAITFGKLAAILGRLMHRGTSLPGKIALSIDKNLLKKLKYPKTRIIVTGSSGKGSTTKMIANILEANGYKVCANLGDSNMAWGVTTALISSSNLFGKIKADYVVLEMDERYVKKVYKEINPNYIVVTNLTKDQPPRNFNLDIIYGEITENLPEDATIITSMDEPYLRKFENEFKNKVIYYSLAKNKYSYKNQIFENLNTYYCPKCHSFLEYDYYNFETMGNYHCPNCDFKYETPKIIGKNLDLENNTMTINDIKIELPSGTLYQANNMLGIYATLDAIGLKKEQIEKGLKECKLENHNIEFTINNKNYYLYNCKAENATTYNQAVFKALINKNKKDIVIGWKEISRRYEHYDVSWLYDIEFELLNNKTLNKVYACGIDKDNIKKRLLLAGFHEEQIITAKTLEDIKEQILESEATDIIGILNFDYMEPFENIFKEESL